MRPRLLSAIHLRRRSISAVPLRCGRRHTYDLPSVPATLPLCYTGLGCFIKCDCDCICLAASSPHGGQDDFENALNGMRADLSPAPAMLAAIVGSPPNCVGSPLNIAGSTLMTRRRRLSESQSEDAMPEQWLRFLLLSELVFTSSFFIRLAFLYIREFAIYLFILVCIHLH